jgi:N-methylhydantoinase A
VGGTFTDAVAVTADGEVHTAKTPTAPDDQAQGVLRAIEEVLARAGAEPREVRRFAHGMTVATNALLEGRTARTALIATAGCTDVIELGRQARPSLYRLCEAAPPPLVPAELRYGAPERCGPDGPLVTLDQERAAELVDELARAEPEAVAVVLLHSYAHPQHELILAELLAKRLGQTHVSVSSELVGTYREYERTASTVLDAALSPLVGVYLRRLAGESAQRGLVEPEVMQSSGGLTSSERAASHAALTVLSGPAGGVGGASLLAELAGERDVLCFDMGGTSCDVCLISGGQVAETAQRTIAGRPLALPALDIHTVGAGGGSIAWRDGGGALRVGPESAGAVPGPACYGRGGERPTVTDANLLLERLPRDTPLAGGMRLDRDAAERAVAGLAQELGGMSVRECAGGIVRVAEAEMARALRVMSIERGVDPRGLALMPFGGAGPLHACALAQELGMTRVLCPRTSGVLSALGLAAAAPRRDVSRTVMLSGETFTVGAVARAREELRERLRAQAASAQIVRERTVCEMRYRGQSHELAVEVRASEPEAIAPETLREAFAREHERRYGYRDDDGEAGVELVTMRMSVWEAAPELRLRGADRSADASAEIGAGVDRSASTGRDTGPHTGTEAGAHTLRGPVVHALPEATLWIAPGWTGEIDEWGTVRLERA